VVDDIRFGLIVWIVGLGVPNDCFVVEVFGVKLVIDLLINDSLFSGERLTVKG
jgi:hypothetical protein